MTQFKNLLNIGTDFQKFQNAYFDIFCDKPSEAFILMYIIKEFNKFNFYNKLKEDGSFYLSYKRIEQDCFKNNITRPTIIKLIDGLIKKKFLKKTTNKNSNEANYYLLNFKHINSLVGKPEMVSDEEYEMEKEDKQETKIIELSELNKQTKSNDTELATKLWNEKIANKYMLIQGIQGITGTREKNFRTRLKESKMSVEEFIDNLEKHIASSDFLQGVSERDWVVTFSWAMKPDNYLKIVEDNFRNISKEEKKKAIDEAIFRDWED